MMTKGKQIRQLSLGSSSSADKLVMIDEADEDTQGADLRIMQISLLRSCPAWPYDLHLRACPYPMIVSQSQLLDIEILHRFLSSAITNIVERWWVDEEAQFPERMPLEKHEQDILRVGWVLGLNRHAN